MGEHIPQASGEKPLWSDCAVANPIIDSLQGHHEADVLVVGGGYTGLSAALHLVEQGVSVILIEANSIGYGASGRNAGLVNAGIWKPPQHVVDELGEEAGGKFNQALFDSPRTVFELVERYQIDCQARRCGTINIAHKASVLDYLQSRCEQMHQLGASTSLIDGEQAQKLSGSPVYKYGGILDPEAGTIQPLSYVRGLAQAAQKLGVKLYQESALLDLQREETRWLATTDNGQVIADKVILASNAYSNQHCQGVRESTVPVFIFHCATEPLDAEVIAQIIPERHGIWDTQTLLTSSRIDDAGRLIMSSAGSLHGIGIARSIRQNWLRRLRKRLYPQVGETKWAYYWSGQIGVTNNSLPRIQLLAPGVFAPSGYNGRGIGTGTVIGKHLAATIVSGNRNEFPFPVETLYRENRRKFRSVYYEYGTLALQLLDRR